MFGKDAKEKTTEAPAAVQPDRGGKGAGVSTLLGRGATFNGKMTTEASVQIDGVFEGEIHVGDTVMVGKEGVVRANVRAGTIVVHGRVEGELNAEKKTELLGGCVVLGKIKTPSLVVQENVHFEGTCQMERKNGSAPAPPKPRG
ncbi:MAG: polymer-forming cytoskeletal protein [Candidatus Eisenbacteria bacterium]|nr:polymer-forming cytoskeletal protein [Candidatus Eisenbacteria bacterium]